MNDTLREKEPLYFAKIRFIIAATKLVHSLTTYGAKSHQIKSSLYSRFFTPKRVRSGGHNLHGRATQLQRSHRLRGVGNTMHDSTGPGTKPWTSRTDSDVTNFYTKRPILTFFKNRSRHELYVILSRFF